MSFFRPNPTVPRVSGTFSLVGEGDRGPPVASERRKVIFPCDKRREPDNSVPKEIFVVGNIREVLHKK